MHQIVPLNLPHAPVGKLYLEEAGRVLRVFSDLGSNQNAEMIALWTDLESRTGAQQEFNKVVIYLKDGSVAHRP
jgi:hypothetical protein